MGLSIHYSGRIKSAESLPLLIEEVSDICKIHGWEYVVYDTRFPDDKLSDELSFNRMYGISFTPKESETVSLAFLANGQMVCPARVHFFANSENDTEKSYIFHNSVKTQYAGIALHQMVIHVFKHLNNRYFCDFQLQDESNYWETEDEDLMREKFKEYDSLVDNFALSIQTFPMKKGESLSSYFKRMMKHVGNLRKQ